MIKKKPHAERAGANDNDNNSIGIFFSYNAYILSKSMNEEPPLEIEVIKWDARSFTIEGANDQLEKLFKEQKIIRALSLRHKGQMGRISRDVRLKARRDFYFTPELNTSAIENPLLQGTTYEYEGLD